MIFGPMSISLTSVNVWIENIDEAILDLIWEYYR